MPEIEFKFGDRVVHATRPEWGTGVVTAAQHVQQNGKRCQRLTLRFDRAGLKTVSTAFAQIRPAEGAEHPAAVAVRDEDRPASWLEELEGRGFSAPEAMSRLPEPATDPFSTPERRLDATLALYRFRPDAGSLLDWAAAQTGLTDPLTRFSRQELESYFDRFAQERDAHVVRLARETKDPSPAFRRALASAPAEARTALRRAGALR